MDKVRLNEERKRGNMTRYNDINASAGRKSAQRRRSGRIIRFLYKALCFVLQVFSFSYTWTLLQSNFAIYAQTTMMLTIVYGGMLFCMHRTYGSLQPESYKIIDCFVGQILSLVISDAAVVTVLSLLLKGLPHLGILALMLAVQIIFALFWCVTANKLYYKLNPPMKTAIVYDNERALESIQEIHLQDNKFNVTSVINARDYADDSAGLSNRLRNVEAAFFCGVEIGLRNELIKFCADHQITAYIRPRISDVLISSARRMHIFHLPTLVYDDHLSSPLYPIIKRAMDIVFASLLLICTSPFMLGVAIAIKLDDRGPVFYRQKRLTKNGKTFEIIKFRSMRTDAEKDGIARLASQGDDRITKVGHFIRATRLDELPQLINILKGEMSIVGPRPERPELTEQYIRELPEFAMRLRVKAGLTGYAQIHGKYNTTPYDKLQMDLMYIADMSLFLDVKLILQTVQVMLQKESTEGISEQSYVQQNQIQKTHQAS